MSAQSREKGERVKGENSGKGKRRVGIKKY